MKRSNEQSKYRWGVVIPHIKKALREKGFHYTPEQVNFMMKLVTGRYVQELTLPNGDRVKMEMPTSSGTVQEFEDWLDDVRDYAYETYGVDIPTPNAIPVEYYGE